MQLPVRKAPGCSVLCLGSPLPHIPQSNPRIYKEALESFVKYHSDSVFAAFYTSVCGVSFFKTRSSPSCPDLSTEKAEYRL